METDQKKRIQKTLAYYDKLSDSYDTGYFAYLEHTHHKFMDWFKANSGDSILDVSAGTGLLAGQLLQQFDEITLQLNEPSAGMRSKAKERIGDDERVRFTSSIAEELQPESDFYDRVICLNSFHYYTDQQSILNTVAECLKPGGKLYLLDWNRQGWFHLPNAIISTLSPENINTRSLDETVAMLQKSGLHIRQRRTWAYRFWKFYLVEAEK